MKKFLCLILCGLLCFPSGMTGKKKGHYEPLFGKKYASYAVTSSSLKGATFYLVSGHGGPDPGCIGKYRGKELHEDQEYMDRLKTGMFDDKNTEKKKEKNNEKYTIPAECN